MSTPGQGSEFRLWVMLSSVAHADADRDSQRPVVGYQGPPKSLLVVDDGRPLAIVHIAELMQAGYVG